MNPQNDNQAKNDGGLDELAEHLERMHHHLIQSKELNKNEQLDSFVADEQTYGELQSAAELMQLLEAIRPMNAGKSKPASCPDESHAENDTVSDSINLAGDTETSLDVDQEYDLDIPRRLSRFELIKPIGQGGYGSVYLAVEANLNREVAIKFPHPAVLTRKDLRQRFMREARSASLLNHPNIVTVFEAGKDAGLYFIAYEYVPGTTLEHVLSEQDALIPFDIAAEIVEILADAIAHAHDRGIIHRDLKPANILFKKLERDQDQLREIKSRIRIADFGLSKAIDDDLTNTRTGAVIGTPAYMAPEQTSGNPAEVGFSCDIYALGSIMYRLLTGQIPFERNSVLETIQAVKVEEPKSPRKLNGKVPNDLEAICLKCLEKNPQQRYSSAFELSEDLRRWRHGFPVKARRVTAYERTKRWIIRNPVTAILTTALSMVILVGLISTTTLWLSASSSLEMANQRQTELRSTSTKLRGAIDRLFFELATSEDLRNENAVLLRQKLLAEANRYYQEFLQDSPQDIHSRLDLVHSVLSLGEINLLLGDFETAHKLGLSAKQNLDAIDNDESHKTAKNTKKQLNTAQVSTLLFLASTLNELGEFEDSQKQFERAQRLADSDIKDSATIRELRNLASIRTRQASVQLSQDKIKQANTTCRDIQVIWSALQTQFGEDCQALPEYERYQVIATFTQAEADRLSGDFPAAENGYKQTLAMLDQLLNMRPNSVELAELYARCQRGLGITHALQSNFETANNCYLQGIPVAAQLSQDNPRVQRFAIVWKQLLYSAAAAAMSQQRYEDVEKQLTVQIDLVDRMIEQWPQSRAELLSGKGDSCNLLFAAYQQWDQRDLEQAEQWLDLSIECFEGVLEIRPDWNRPKMALARAISNKGNICFLRNQHQQAIRWFEKAYQQNETLLDEQSEWIEVKNSQALVLFNLLVNCLEMNDDTSASQHYDEFVKHYPTHYLRPHVEIQGIYIEALSGNIEMAIDELATVVNSETESNGGPSNAVAIAVIAARIADLCTTQSLDNDAERCNAFAIELINRAMPDTESEKDSYLQKISDNKHLKQIVDQIDQ